MSLGGLANGNTGTDSRTQQLAVVCQLPEDVSVDLSKGCAGTGGKLCLFARGRVTARNK